MKNTIIYLIGFPGTGKLTTAKALCKISGANLVDNHLINNPIFTLVERDGKSPLPDEVWRQAHNVRKAVLETIEKISPQDYNFVFTNVLVDDDWVDREIYKCVEQTAINRNATFVPVRLTCEIEENMRRITMPDRKENMKEMTPETARAIRQDKDIISISHNNLLDLDITNSAPETSAKTILDHALSCQP